MLLGSFNLLPGVRYSVNTFDQPMNDFLIALSTTYKNEIIFLSNPVFKKTRRLKSFPWDALVHGSIMAFYLNLEKLGKPERCVML